MEQSEKSTLCRQLGTVDDSLGFLLVIIAAILLSFWSVVIQRRGLCLTIEGEGDEAAGLPKVFPLKCRSSAMLVGALGFFLWVALRARRDAEAGDDCVAKRSAGVNVIASLLVLAAAVLRLDDLQFVERCQTALVNGDILPD